MFTLDRRAPETRIEWGPKTTEEWASPVFEFVSDEPGSRFECRRADGTYSEWKPCAPGQPVTGIYRSVAVRAIDPVGNIDDSPAEWGNATHSIPTSFTASADSATVYATGDFGLAASSAGRASADASGLALAGILAAGGSFAHANVAEQVATHVYGSSLIDAGSITLSAAVTPNTTTPAVSASASGSSGAMVGLTATEAKAVNISGAGTLVEHSALAATGHVMAWRLL